MVSPSHDAFCTTLEIMNDFVISDLFVYFPPYYCRTRHHWRLHPLTRSLREDPHLLRYLSCQALKAPLAHFLDIHLSPWQCQAHRYQESSQEDPVPPHLSSVPPWAAHNSQERRQDQEVSLEGMSLMREAQVIKGPHCHHRSSPGRRTGLVEPVCVITRWKSKGVEVLRVSVL